jgi:two-component system, OmpR family, phosphate regulon response regulator PhoB
MRRKEILLVEDDRDQAELTAMRLEKEGFSVYGAADGESGITQARLRIPDLIILDLGLPRLTGFEVCKQIREDENPAVARIPILILTGKTDDADRVIGRVVGAQDYISKPYSPQDLVQRVVSCINV